MKKVAVAIIVVGVLSILAAVVCRAMVVRLPVCPGGVMVSAVLSFANTCFLLAISLLVLRTAK
jgi:hypothetical protein